jgi:deoxyadenosine/deoxycytidine kinase
LGKLVTVVGNSGVGKTTFTCNLCQIADYTLCLEQHIERPFYKLFMENLQKYALANQIDYLLYRAEQEIDIRGGAKTGVQDGGLDQDFFVFTRLFYRKFYLNDDEYTLCERTYWLLREILSPPTLIIWIQAPLDKIIDRYSRRMRGFDIAQIEDLETIEFLLKDWLDNPGGAPVYVIKSGSEDPSYSKVIPKVIDLINSMD